MKSCLRTLSTFFKISLSCVLQKKKLTEGQNDSRMNKWWNNSHLGEKLILNQSSWRMFRMKSIVSLSFKSTCLKMKLHDVKKPECDQSVQILFCGHCEMCLCVMWRAGNAVFMFAGHYKGGQKVCREKVTHLFVTHSSCFITITTNTSPRDWAHWQIMDFTP